MSEKRKYSRSLLILGLLFIVLQLTVLLLANRIQGSGNVNIGPSVYFFISYIPAILFLILMLSVNRTFFNFRKIDRKLILVSLTLFAVGCYTLNQSLILFAPFVSWLTVVLVVFHLAMLMLGYYEYYPVGLRAILSFILGFGLVITHYFAVYLGPIYPIAIIGLFFLGITVFIFVPLFFSIYVIRWIWFLRKPRLEKYAFFLGIILPLIVAAVFLVRWNRVFHDIHRTNASIITRPDNTLPSWVLLCQEIATDRFTARVIEGDIVYDTFNDMWWGGRRGDIFTEQKKHDPLINMGMAFMPDLPLSDDMRIKVLRSQLDARHESQRKLWRGNDLAVTEVLGKITLYPEYRMAYTEKIISIRNNSRWRNSSQEAAFTFHLPEGSVATSLSLWIEGKEQFSRLSTRQKADSAYVSIVGVERRDPALLHWQEGNTLTLTVFPCTPEEERKFRIGITSPMEKRGENLILPNVYFEGPALQSCLETTVVECNNAMGKTVVGLPRWFREEEGKFIYSGRYHAGWEIKIPDSGLANGGFSFLGAGYHVKPMSVQNKSFTPQVVFLDINKSWTREEFIGVMELYSSVPAYVYNDQLIRIHPENRDVLFEKLSKHNFSLFPFNMISEPEKSLIVTKSTALSPFLSDLKDSPFLEKLNVKLKEQGEKYYMFQIGNTCSPYIRSLKELGIFHFTTGKVDELEELTRKRIFPVLPEDENVVHLDISNMSIVRDSIPVALEAPDHLLRLFAYEKLMSKLGREFFKSQYSMEDELLQLANEAFIVSPVSSLVVLESKQDYDRFGIEENKNSLKNASASASGAVPEPGEWLLIGVLAATVLVLFGRKRLTALRINSR